MDCSTSGLPVFHYLLEFPQVHIHWIGDALQQDCSYSAIIIYSVVSGLWYLSLFLQFLNITSLEEPQLSELDGNKDIAKEGDGTPLWNSCLENPMDGGAWWATVHGIVKSRTRLRDFTFTFHFHALEKEMTTHSSVLAWRIPGTVEPNGLPSMGLNRVRHDWSDLAAVAATLWVTRNIHVDSRMSVIFLIVHWL